MPASVLMCMSGNMACAAAPTSTAPLWCSREQDTEGNVSSGAAASAPNVASGISNATWQAEIMHSAMTALRSAELCEWCLLCCRP